MGKGYREVYVKAHFILHRIKGSGLTALTPVCVVDTPGWQIFASQKLGLCWKRYMK